MWRRFELAESDGALDGGAHRKGRVKLRAARPSADAAAQAKRAYQNLLLTYDLGAFSYSVHYELACEELEATLLRERPDSAAHEDAYLMLRRIDRAHARLLQMEWLEPRPQFILPDEQLGDFLTTLRTSWAHGEQQPMPSRTSTFLSEPFEPGTCPDAPYATATRRLLYAAMQHGVQCHCTQLDAFVPCPARASQWV